MADQEQPKPQPPEESAPPEPLTGESLAAAIDSLEGEKPAPPESPPETPAQETPAQETPAQETPARKSRRAGDETQTGQPTMPLPAASSKQSAASPVQSAASSKQSAAPSPAPERGVQGRAASYRLTTLVAGALLVALGVIYLWPLFSGGDILIPEAILGIALAGFALSLLAYWWNTRRQARGALFLALAILLAAGFTAALALLPELRDSARAAQLWPGYLLALGLALLLTAFGGRAGSGRLLLPALILLAAGAAGLGVTLGALPAEVTDFAAQYGPWLAVILAIGLLPLAVRRETRQD